MSLLDLGRGVWDLGFPFLLAMGAPAQGANAWVQFIPFALVLAIFYFVILL